MSSLFKSPQQPAAPAPVIVQAPPPTVDNAAASREQADMARKRRGRAATLLTGSSGAGAPTDVAVKTLTGQ